MSEFGRQRLYAGVLIGALGVVGITGCGSDNEAGQISCTADHADQWTNVPFNFDLDVMAEKLGVNITDLIQHGTYGPATCDGPIDMSAIGTGQAPIVAVEEKGDACLVLGSQVDPSQYDETDRVIVVCAPQNEA